MPDINVEWQKNGFILPKESGIISEYRTIATSISESDGNDVVFELLAELMWTREFRNSDEGVYECVVHQRNTSLKVASQRIELEAVPVSMHTVTNRPWSACRSSIVDERVMYFQIRMFGVECQTWMKSRNLEHIATQVHHQLILTVKDECNCGVDDKELELVGMPLCSTWMGDAAMFHGVIQTNSPEKTGLLFCALSFWLERSAQLQIDGTFQTIDSSCPLKALETFSEECVPPVAIEAVTPIMGNSNVKEIVAVAGGIGGFTLVVILLITVVCCIGCYYLYQLRTRNLSGKCDDGSVQYGAKEIAQGGDHTYDQ